MERLMSLIKDTFIGAISAIFLIFGIINLSNAYQLNNPLEFVMTFFSASLMIMISIVGIIYLTIRIHSFFKGERGKNHESNQLE